MALALNRYSALANPLNSPSTPPGAAPYPLYYPGARPPALTASTPATHYSWYRDQIQKTLKPGQILGYTPGQGYYAKTGMAVAAHPTPQLSETDRLLKLLYGQIETGPQQEARVNREVEAQIAAQKKMMDDEYARQVADANAQAQAMNAAGLAAAGMSKDLLGLVGGQYNAGAQEIAGLAHGLSGAFGAATAADVKGDNKGLARVGAPALTEGGQGGYGGSAQQAVENYRGGTLGSQLLSGEGEAESFGLAGMTAAQTLQAQQTAQAGLMTAMHDIRANQAKALDSLAAGRADLYHTYMNDSKDSQVKAISLIQGLIAQKQASATAATKARIDAAKFRTQTTLAKQRIALTAGSLQARMQNQSFQQNMAQIRETRLSDVSAVNMAATKQRLENAALSLAISSGAVDVNRSKAKGVVVDKLGRVLPGIDGKPIPAARLATAAKTKTMTPNQIAGQAAKATQLASDLFYGYGTNKQGKRVPISQLGGFDPDDAKTYGTGRVTYTKALQTLRRQKVPEATARSALNAVYERGDQGRPFFSPHEKQILTAAYTKQYGKVAGLRHYQGLLNTLNTQLAHGETAAFDTLVSQVLHAVGL
jgi:hypothetical protein